jgi:hypothetical protein
MNRSEFLDTVDCRHGELARRGSERIINAAEYFEFDTEYWWTEARGDARAIFSKYEYKIFGIFSYDRDSVDDARFVIYKTDTFDKYHSDVAVRFRRYWKLSVYEHEAHKYGFIPVSAPDAIERVCFAFGAYVAITDSLKTGK